ncbi:MAG: bis(5'-nucleosyl)-tetraphosphatase [Thermoplasmataceae archaeon]
MDQETSSGMVVCRKTGNIMKFLLLDRREGFLDFPKGHIEAGESDKQAAEREVREETGLDLQPVDGFRYVQDYWYTRNRNRIHKTVIMFLAIAPPDAAVIISHEHTGYRWLTAEECKKQLSYDNQKILLNAVLEKLSGLKDPV